MVLNNFCTFHILPYLAAACNSRIPRINVCVYVVCTLIILDSFAHAWNVFFTLPSIALLLNFSFTCCPYILSYIFKFYTRCVKELTESTTFSIENNNYFVLYPVGVIFFKFSSFFEIFLVIWASKYSLHLSLRTLFNIINIACFLFSSLCEKNLKVTCGHLNTYICIYVRHAINSFHCFPFLLIPLRILINKPCIQRKQQRLLNN